MTHTVRGTAALILVVGLVSGGTGAQDRQTFRTSTRLVEVSVVVTDRSGNPLRGLTRQDFAVTDSGRPQEIAFFEPIGTAASRVSSTRGVSFMARAEFSNVTPPAAVRTLILLDRTNAAFANQWYSRRHAETYLRRKSPDDWLALYAWDGAVRALHDFTTDATSLLKALDTYHAHASADDEASTAPAEPSGEITAWIADPAANVAEFFAERRALTTFDAFELLASHLRDIAGRKNVIWLSEGFAIPQRFGRQDFLARMRAATDALSDAQASLYPVDARGLVGAISTDRRGVASFTSMATIAPNNDTMEIVASNTGGRAFANTNDLASSIERAVDDSRGSYVLGYYAPEAADGRFRRIDVAVQRKGVQVRHRAGYFAAPAPSREERFRRAAARQALEAPLQATAVAFAANAHRVDDTSETEFTIRIDPASLSFERAGEIWRAAADLMIAQVDSAGRGQVNATVPAAIALTDSQRDRARTEGIALTHRLILNERTHQVRIVVRDVPSGRVGSLIVPAAKLRPGGAPRDPIAGT